MYNRWWGRQQDVIRLKTKHVSESTQHSKNVRKAYTEFLRNGYNMNIHPDYIFQGIEKVNMRKLIAYNMIEVFIRFVCSESNIIRSLIDTEYDWDNGLVSIFIEGEFATVIEIISDETHPSLVLKDGTSY